MAWTNLPNSIFLVGKKITSSTGLALRDNPGAAMRGNTGAPYAAAGWHPFDGLAVGDGNDGVIYDFAVHGAVASVVSPDFEDGYEYLFIADALSSSASTTGFLVELYRETAASYAAAFVARTYATTLSAMLYARVEVKSPRTTARGFVIEVQCHESAIDATAALSTDSGIVTVATAQKILRARLSFAGANFGSGTIRMMRRLAF
jgi:hypothetical protein